MLRTEQVWVTQCRRRCINEGPVSMGVALSHDLLRVSLCCSWLLCCRANTFVCYNIKVSLLLYMLMRRMKSSGSGIQPSQRERRKLIAHGINAQPIGAEYRKSRINLEVRYQGTKAVPYTGCTPIFRDFCAERLLDAYRMHVW